MPKGTRFRLSQLPTSVRVILFMVDLLGRLFRRLFSLFSPFWRQGEQIPEPGRILVLHYMHLGDTIVTTPALKALRNRFPNAYIVFLASPSGAQILQGNPSVNEVRSFQAPWLDRFSLPHHERSGLRKILRFVVYYWRCLATIVKEAKKLRAERFDLGIDLVGIFQHPLLMALARIKVRIGPKGLGDWLLTHPISLPDPRTLHEIDRCLSIIRELGGTESDKRPFVAVFTEAEQQIAKRLRQQGIAPNDLLVVIHPGCVSAPASRWHPERWAQVADTLIREYGAKVVLNGVESERPEIEAIKAHMKEKAIDFCGQLTIPELVALIRRCNLLLTVNSGPMHIASALWTPMVVVQGAWNLARWRPYGDNHILVVKDVPCVNCGFPICPKPVSCMDMITPEEVIDAAVRKLQEIGAIKR